MNRGLALKLLTKHRPTTLESLLQDCGFTLRLQGNGAFRWVYEIVGSNLVVKVPAKEAYCLKHARNEYAAWKRVTRSTKKYKALRPYMPEIVYFDSKSGIIVVKKYRLLPDGWYESKRDKINRLITQLTECDDADVSRADNYGLDGRQLKIIDLGCFLKGVDEAFK